MRSTIEFLRISKVVMNIVAMKSDGLTTSGSRKRSHRSSCVLIRPYVIYTPKSVYNLFVFDDLYEYLAYVYIISFHLYTMHETRLLVAPFKAFYDY